MPEGHTLHRLARDLRAAFAGGPVAVSSPQGRFAHGAALLDGLEVEDAQAWGKHLYVAFAGERLLHMHLGLIGIVDLTRYAVGPDPSPPPPVGAVRVRLLNDTWVADVRGATVVDAVTPGQQADTLARLGPDPLRAGQPGQDPHRALAKIARSGRTIGELLMDQSVLAGVGNVYRAEVLWRQRVNPLTRKVKPASFLAIWDDLVDLMPLGVAFGRIITLPGQVQAARELLAAATDGEPTAYPLPREYAAYRRTGQPCPRCGARIRTQPLAGRHLYWCGRCQQRT